ncbi:MAG TPA: hypothetical protein VIM12_11475 [Noviherbaspirillum sp.]|uniref:hypothetical protein n=1 Tax=Noviherbaspirillum sp. TaxID=1926288 RepID=UPI002F923891
MARLPMLSGFRRPPRVAKRMTDEAFSEKAGNVGLAARTWRRRSFALSCSIFSVVLFSFTSLF